MKGLSRLLFGLALGLTLAFFGVSAWYAWLSYRDFEALVVPESRFAAASGLIGQLDEALTMSARMAAATGDQRWERRYNALEPQLDSAIQEARRSAPDLFAGEAARRTDAANQALVALEHRAFDLVRQGRSDSAESLLSTAEYETQKHAYAEGLQRIRTTLGARSRAQATEQLRRVRGTLVAAGAALPVLVLAWLAVWTLARRYDAERRRAEASIRDAKALLDAILSGSTDAIYVKDIEGRYLLFNPEAARVTGKPPDAVLGRDDTFLFPPAEAQVVMDGDRQVMALGRTTTYEETVTTSEGIRTFLSTKGPVFDERSNVVGLFGVARDITRRKQAEERLERQAAELQDALANVKTLTGFIPICASCKKIRDDQGYWNQIEKYLLEHSDAQFSHGLCPACLETFLPGLSDA